MKIEKNRKIRKKQKNWKKQKESVITAYYLNWIEIEFWRELSKLYRMQEK